MACRADRSICTDGKCFERRLYESLGIRYFGKFLLYVERLKHRRDGLQNRNYHPADVSVSSLKSFTGYLLYNSTFHVIGLILAIACYVLALCSGISDIRLTVLLVLIVVFNAYCLILQRYTFLCLGANAASRGKRRAICIQKYAERIRERLSDKPDGELKEETKLLARLRNCADLGSDMPIDEADAAVLERISALTEQKTAYRNTRESAFNVSVPATAVIKRRLAVHGFVERAASFLQRIFIRRQTENVSFGYCIVSENAAAEKAYRKVFFSDCRDDFEKVLSALEAAYAGETQRRGGTDGKC